MPIFIKLYLQQENVFYEDFQDVSTEIVKAEDDKDAIRQLCKMQFEITLL